MLLLPPQLRRRPLLLLLVTMLVAFSLIALMRLPGGPAASAESAATLTSLPSGAAHDAAVDLSRPRRPGSGDSQQERAQGGRAEVGGGGGGGDHVSRSPLVKLLDDLRPEELQTHLEYLSDDLMEGRGTGTRGEELATLYIAAQMKLIGLFTTKSASTSPSLKDYIVDVPLVGISTTESRRAAADADRPRPPLTFTRLHEASTQTTTTVDTRGTATADNSQPCQTDESEEAGADPANQQCGTGGDGDDEEDDSSGNRADGADAERSGGVDEGEGADRVELRLWDDFVVTADYQAIREAMADGDTNEAAATGSATGETEWRVTADELVFLGFGIHAEQWSRNDYRDADGGEVDIRGKLVVCFVNEPQPTEDQPDLFEGSKLTYYGRWTYKVEEVRRRGARGIFLIYTPDTAGYPFTVISNNREPLQVPAKRFNVGLEVVAWLTEESAASLARLCGSTLAEWYDAAVSPDFVARRLPVATSFDVVLGVRSFKAKNVAGLLPGETSECILITAHHDHLGMGPPGDSDQDRIYNGAVDNASGVSMMLTLARALAQHRGTLKRSFLFVSLTGEEAGLIGAQAYVANPPVPLTRTLANINFDMLNLDGLTLDIVGLGSDETKLGRMFTAAAHAEGMSVSGDPNPGQGSFIRSDSWVFHKAGIPSIYPWTGKHFVGRPSDYAATRKAWYVKTKYHGPGDEYDPRWSLAGALQQGRVALRLAYALATSTRPLNVDADELINQIGRAHV